MILPAVSTSRADSLAVTVLERVPTIDRLVLRRHMHTQDDIRLCLSTSKEPAGCRTVRYSPVNLINRISKPYKTPPPPPIFLRRLTGAMS